jgi:hypothetical protein
MEITSTKNLILHSIYEDLPPSLHLQMELDYAFDPTLAEEEPKIIAAKEILSSFRIQPNEKCIQNLLHYSKKTRSNLTCT